MFRREAQRLESSLIQALRLPERRQQPRFPIRVSLVVKTLDIVTNEIRSETFQGWSEDISTTGIRIIVPRVPLTGQLWVNLRTRRLRKRWFEVAPVWSTGVRTTRGLRQRAGISFLTPIEREELDRMLVARALSELRATVPHDIASL